MITFLIALSITLSIIAVALQVWNEVDKILYRRKQDKEIEAQLLAEFGGDDDGDDDSDYGDYDC